MALFDETPNDGDGYMASRLEDYLNDKIQTFADFESLDALLANVGDQQMLLRTQLDEAQQTLEATDQEILSRRTALERKTQEYQKQSADIDRRLRIATSSETSDDALRKLDASMQQFNTLQIASRYLDMLSEVENLSKEIISTFKLQPDQALASYMRLHSLSSRLNPLQQAAEGGAPHLVDHVNQCVKGLQQVLKESFAADLEAVLAKILWPKPDLAIPSTFSAQWVTACKRLLTLQKPDLEASEMESTYRQSASASLAILFPLEVLTRPLVKRFNFHFSGDKPTNKLDKPEYFLSHTLDLLNTYFQFVSDYFQPILFQSFGSSDLSSYFPYIDAQSAFITAILPMPRNKVFSLVPQLLAQPNLLSHLIHELMGFDNALREEWHYTGASMLATDKWKDLTWEILNQGDYFDRWLQAEKEFALARYEAIVNDQDSATLDYDSLDAHATKPTKAAIRVNDLLETVTERYRPLLSFSQKLRFLIDIQISIFDRFHARLNSGLEAFLTMTSSIGRTVQGSSASEVAELEGVKGLDRLCRIFGSSDYLERAMRDWSDDIFFLDLWNELQDRVNARSTDANGDYSTAPSTTLVAGPLSVAEVASKTSSSLAAVVPEDELQLEDVAKGALFDETAAAYARLREKSESALIDTLNSRLRESLRPYARNNPWSSLAVPSSTGPAQGESSTEEPQSTSVELNQVLQTLSSNFGFLSKALGSLPLRKIARQIAKSMDGYIFDRVLMGNTFSLQGAQQVAIDIETLAATLDSFAGGNVGVKGMRKSLEARVLLSLPVRGTGETADDSEAAWDVDEDVDAAGEEEKLNLWTAQDRLFESNQTARDLLEELGLEHLTESEAREVVRRRVEIVG